MTTTDLDRQLDELERRYSEGTISTQEWEEWRWLLLGKLNGMERECLGEAHTWDEFPLFTTTEIRCDKCGKVK